MVVQPWATATCPPSLALPRSFPPSLPRRAENRDSLFHPL